MGKGSRACPGVGESSDGLNSTEHLERGDEDDLSRAKRTAAPVEKKQGVIRKEEWQPTNILLVILGLEVPLLGGFWVWNNDPWYYAMFLAVPLGALLLRSWWVLLIVPIVFAIGIALGILLPPFLQGGWPALQDRLNKGLEGVDILLLTFPLFSTTV